MANFAPPGKNKTPKILDTSISTATFETGHVDMVWHLGSIPSAVTERFAMGWGWVGLRCSTLKGSQMPLCS